MSAQYPIEKFYGIYNDENQLVADLHREQEEADDACTSYRFRADDGRDYSVREVLAIVLPDGDAVVVAQLRHKRSVR